MRNLFSLLLRVVLVVVTCSTLGAHALKFEFVTTHQETPGEVAAQGTTLFLSTLTGLDFTAWEAKILSSTDKETRFDVIADLPVSREAEIRDQVFDYVKNGVLNKNFAEQGFPGVKVRLISDKKPSLAPVPSPVPQTKEPKKSPENHNAQPGNDIGDNHNNNNNKGNKGKNGNNDNGNNGKVKSEWTESEEPSSDPIEPTAEPIPSKKPLPPTPKPSPEEVDVPPTSPLAERNLQLPEGYVLSKILPILIESPIYGFPSDLRDAVKWLLSEVTGTDVENWVLWDAIETSPNKYNAMFRYIGPQGTTDGVVATAKAAVQDDSLERMLVEIDNAGEFKLYMGKIIDKAPGDGNNNNNNGDNNNNADSGESSGPTGEVGDIPVPPGGESAATIEATAAPELDIELSETQEIYPVRISVKSPSKGWKEEIGAEIVAFASSRSDTLAEDWMLKSATESATEAGVYTVEYAVRIESKEREAVDNYVVTMVRNRELDTHMDIAGFEDVEVTLLARTFSDDEDNNTQNNNNNNKKGIFRSTSGTIAASIVGVVIVIAIGIIVAVCCLPKRRSRNSNNDT